MNYVQLNKECKEYCQLVLQMLWFLTGIIFKLEDCLCLYYVPLNLNILFGKVIH